MSKQKKYRLDLKKQNKISRRQFVKDAAAVGTFTIVPRHVLGGAGYTPPSEKLNIAGVGVVGIATYNLKSCRNENIVALCDVDDNKAAKALETYPSARTYRDYRKMLDKQKEIDAVVIATPDHTHAVIAMEAIKRGKHVYVQKPLTHSIYEARMLTEAARKYNVATQMGNQGRSGEGIRQVKEWIEDGAIGQVREVHVWTNRPIWPQGIGRPKKTPPVPTTFDWDLWLGPAPYRAYNPAYAPFKWRAWLDFGTGALGDMGCHLIDVPFWALDLEQPITVQASSTPVNDETYPVASIIHYEFGARRQRCAVKLHWYDGGLMPQRPEELEEGLRMGDKDGGVLFIGDKGKLMCGSFGESPMLIPVAKMNTFKRPPKKYTRAKENHEKNWITACKGGKPAYSNFDYAGPLTELILLGNLALRAGNKSILQWDGPNMQVTNMPEANQYLKRQYRKGWSL